MRVKVFLRGMLFCILMLMMSLPALAASQVKLWVSADGTHGIDAIEWYQYKEAYYLFLPGNVELADLKIGVEENQKLVIGGGH